MSDIWASLRLDCVFRGKAGQVDAQDPRVARALKAGDEIIDSIPTVEDALKKIRTYVRKIKKAGFVDDVDGNDQINNPDVSAKYEEMVSRLRGFGAFNRGNLKETIRNMSAEIRGLRTYGGSNTIFTILGSPEIKTRSKVVDQSADESVPKGP